MKACSLFRRVTLAPAVALFVLLTGPPVQRAQATPVLQLYLEGATYDTTTNTWVLDTTKNNPNWQQYLVPGTDITHFRLWAIGDTSQSKDGTIHNVRVAASYDANPGWEQDWDPTFKPYVSLTMKGSTTGGLGGFVDPSKPADAKLLQTVTDGSAPKLSDGTPLTSLSDEEKNYYHAGRVWQEFALGDFTLHDSPIADFMKAFPSAPKTTTGEINAYDVYVENSALYGDSTLAIHFDLYDSILSGNKGKSVFADHNHDGTAIVPAPPGVVLLGTGGACLAGFGWWRRTSRRRFDTAGAG